MVVVLASANDLSFLRPIKSFASEVVSAAGFDRFVFAMRSALSAIDLLAVSKPILPENMADKIFILIV